MSAAGVVEEPTVVIYLSQLCGYCHAARRLLDNKGWPYERIGVDGDTGRRAEMQKRSGRHTVPQIFIGDTHVGGYDDLAELEADGELDELYASAG